MESFIDGFGEVFVLLFCGWVLSQLSGTHTRLKNIEKYLQLTGMPKDEEVLRKMWKDKFQPQSD